MNINCRFECRNWGLFNRFVHFRSPTNFSGTTNSSTPSPATLSRTPYPRQQHWTAIPHCAGNSTTPSTSAGQSFPGSSTGKRYSGRPDHWNLVKGSIDHHKYHFWLVISAEPARSRSSSRRWRSGSATVAEVKTRTRSTAPTGGGNRETGKAGLLLKTFKSLQRGSRNCVHLLIRSFGYTVSSLPHQPRKNTYCKDIKESEKLLCKKLVPYYITC